MELKSCAEYNINDFVARADPASCSDTGHHVNFCVHGTKIYSLNEASSCRSAFMIPVDGLPSTVVNYLELEDDKLNAIRLDGTAKIYDFGDTTKIDDIQNYILVDCVHGICRQTQGYLLYNNIINAFVGTKGGDNSESLKATGIDNTTNKECTNEHIGKFLDVTPPSSSGVCIKAGKAAKLASNDRYLISNAVDGTPFKDSDGVALLKISDKYIIKDKLNSEGMN